MWCVARLLRARVALLGSVLRLGVLLLGILLLSILLLRILLLLLSILRLGVVVLLGRGAAVAGLAAVVVLVRHLVVFSTVVESLCLGPSAIVDGGDELK